MPRIKKHKIEIEIASVLRAKRRALGYTLTQVAKAIPLTYSQYSKMERGLVGIPVNVIGYVSEFLGVEFIFSVRGAGIANPKKGLPRFKIGDQCKMKVNDENKSGSVIEIKENTFDAKFDGFVVENIPKSEFRKSISKNINI